tara:strand:+ start:2196 stop:2828 length:633 start_codon:yes stop_codon:yes gene_type:complete
MVKKGFPKFGMSQAGAYVTSLKNYNLPDFILKLVAKDTDSELLERGRIDDRLQSMNDSALELLNKIFVECEEDKKGKYAQYRFFAYVSSMYHKCEVLVNETIPGKSGKEHKIPISIKSNGMFISIAFNKATGHPINKKDILKFFEISEDVKDGEHGTQLIDAIYGSSVGFSDESMIQLRELISGQKKEQENKLEYKTANFENRIYSVTKC